MGAFRNEENDLIALGIKHLPLIHRITSQVMESPGEP
jgi:hypothetical protein